MKRPHLRTYRVTLIITQDDDAFIPLSEWDWADVIDPGMNPGFAHRVDSIEGVPLDTLHAETIAAFDEEDA